MLVPRPLVAVPGTVILLASGKFAGIFIVS
jgi:hypothetical protein